MVTKHILQELGHEVILMNHVDSQSAKAWASKRGLGRMKHVMLKYMYVQDVVEKKLTNLAYISTKQNKARVLCSTVGASLAEIRGLCQDDGGCAPSVQSAHFVSGLEMNPSRWFHMNVGMLFSVAALPVLRGCGAASPSGSGLHPPGILLLRLAAIACFLFVLSVKPSPCSFSLVFAGNFQQHVCLLSLYSQLLTKRTLFNLPASKAFEHLGVQEFDHESFQQLPECL